MILLATLPTEADLTKQCLTRHHQEVQADVLYIVTLIAAIPVA